MFFVRVFFLSRATSSNLRKVYLGQGQGLLFINPGTPTPVHLVAVSLVSRSRLPTLELVWTSPARVAVTLAQQSNACRTSGTIQEHSQSSRRRSRSPRTPPFDPVSNRMYFRSKLRNFWYLIYTRLKITTGWVILCSFVFFFEIFCGDCWLSTWW